MTDKHTVRSGQDLITGLIEQLGAEQTRDWAARELVPAVHAAVYPMCLRMLGNRDDAYDVEHDTVLRLLNRVNSPNTSHEPVIQGKAFVRQIARNLCVDRLRETGRAVSLDDLSEGDLPVAVDADPDSAVTSLAVIRTLTDKTLPARYDKALSAAFGYTSQQLLGDFAGLPDLGLKVVMLRQLGLPDKEIAQRLGAGLTTVAVQQQGLRAMNHLRGIVHVRVWRQQSLADWDEPPCTTLAALKAEVKTALAANQKINDGLYQKIGKHLNPDPNRTSGSDRVPVCAICEHERENSRQRYWWMLVFLAIFPLAESRPKLVLTAQHTDLPPLDTVSPANGLDHLEPTGASPTRDRRYQRIMAGALLGILLLAGIGISAGVGRGQALSAPQSDLPRASSFPSPNPLFPEQPSNDHTSGPGGSANGGPAGGPDTGSTGGSDSPPPGDTAAPPSPAPPAPAPPAPAPPAPAPPAHAPPAPEPLGDTAASPAPALTGYTAFVPPGSDADPWYRQTVHP